MKYRFEIIYRNNYMKEASRLLKNMDLECEVGIKDTVTFTSKNNPSISKIKENFKTAFESCDMELMHIEGGKIE